MLARALPFVVFVLLTCLEQQFGRSSQYWVYFLKTLVGAWFIFEMRAAVPEMKWAFSVEALLVGIVVFALWVGLDPYYPPLFGKGGATWNPHLQFGLNSAAAWFFIVARITGMTFVVPMLEEVFFRSFLYRAIAEKDFMGMPLNQFRPGPFLITSVLFGIEHHQWLAGILAGLAYHWLVFRKGRLGDAITAHAITNFLLGVWVIWKSAWNFF
ncbi:MAG: prenyl protease-related protein [Verrucomicrobiales bacterium]|nr:prenyl protease-related protein [Verrucomicrobiales bacterium]